MDQSDRKAIPQPVSSESISFDEIVSDILKVKPPKKAIKDKKQAAKLPNPKK